MAVVVGQATSMWLVLVIPMSLSEAMYRLVENRCSMTGAWVVLQSVSMSSARESACFSVILVSLGMLSVAILRALGTTRNVSQARLDGVEESERRHG